MKEKSKVLILTTGRFHVGNLARILSNENFDVTFSCWLPPWHLNRIGLKRQKIKTFFLFLGPILLLTRIVPSIFRMKFNLVLIKLLDLLTLITFYKNNIDIVIFMSQTSLKTVNRLKRNNPNLKIICERGSTHIKTQYKILSQLGDIQTPSREVIARELDSYNISDFISIPSKHVFKSFEEEGERASKLIMNPYGVDISIFSPPRIKINKKIILQTGAWSLRKGADLIIDAVKDLPDFHFIHVGPILDYPFPSHSRFIHYDAVQEYELPKFYQNASVFILPSREEGLALVQAQALASGLPIVYTERSGGDDLLEFVHNKGQLIKTSLSAEDLRESILVAQSFYEKVKFSDNKIIDYKNLTWEAYGQRYAKFLRTI